MRPELPFLAAGGVAVVGGAIAQKKWPKDVAGVLIGTVALVIVASATAGSRIAPLVRAIGLLLLLASVMGAVKRINESKR